MQYLAMPLGQNSPWYTFRITLSKVLYTMEVRYNIRMDRWLLSLYDAAMNPLVMGMPLLVTRAIGAQYVTLALPPGTFFVQDDSGKNAQPTLASFLLDHRFFYADPTA